MRVHRLLAAAAVATAAVLVPLARPAGATVVVSTSGPNVTVAVTGTLTIRTSCSGGKVAINTVVALPALDCSAFAKLTVTGDGSTQVVQGSDLDAVVFTAHPRLVATLGGGSDLVAESAGADSIDLGPGNDVLLLRVGSSTNVLLDVGPDTDSVTLTGTTAGETLSLASTTTSLALTSSSPIGPVLWTVLGAETAKLDALGGADTVSATAVTAASSVDLITLLGGDGDDTITASAIGGYAEGGPGTNTFHGGAGTDRYTSTSATDVVELAGGSANVVVDQTSLRSGGRTITGTGSAGDFRTILLEGQDSTTRVRPGPSAGTAVVTNSLDRTGQQALGSSFDEVFVERTAPAGPTRSVTDVVAVAQAVTITNDPEDDDIDDITIPTGTWTRIDDPGGSTTIDPSAAGLGTITVLEPGTVAVHGPWTNTYEGFGHRAIRDLQFRIASDGDRIQIRNALATSAKTRPQVIAELIDTDLYRGLDVDRTFTDYLGRQADPSGKAYWIDKIDEGRSLRQFRSELFGGSEYFNRAGATTAGFVRSAYRDVLGRLPDPAGEAYWVNKITQGATRSKVAKQFLVSTEARRFIVEDQYLRFLDRTPTGAESTAGMATVNATTDGEQRLIAQLVASPAYYARS